MPHAARLADLFEKEFGLSTEYIKGGGGLLEVLKNGKVVWTNRENRGYKATNDEARAAMQEFLGRQ